MDGNNQYLKRGWFINNECKLKNSKIINIIIAMYFLNQGSKIKVWCKMTKMNKELNKKILMMKMKKKITIKTTMFLKTKFLILFK